MSSSTKIIKSKYPYLQSVQNQSGQSLSVHILGNDDQGLSVLVGQLQGRHNILHLRDLLLAQQDQGLLEFNLKHFD